MNVLAASASPPNYGVSTQMARADHVRVGVSTIATLFEVVSSLIPQATPLSQVLGVTKELVAIIDQMRDNKGTCSFLVERILRFLKVLSEECAQLNEPIREGTPTALRISELVS